MHRTQCQKCRPGFFSAASGSSAINAAKTGNANCDECPAGLFQEVWNVLLPTSNRTFNIIRLGLCSTFQSHSSTPQALVLSHLPLDLSSWFVAGDILLALRHRHDRAFPEPVTMSICAVAVLHESGLARLFFATEWFEAVRVM